MTTFLHDPQSRLPYALDFADWLSEGETITSHTATVTGATKVSDHHTGGTSVTVWVTGGTVGTTATIACHVVTSLGLEDDRTLRLRIVDR